ncbi:MAG TPA: aldehyde dehydrogenase family protein [Chloroflexota bacterium]|nr:aldehyde dehydrogenase family protein [Chloroflexota bacterium]
MAEAYLNYIGGRWIPAQSGGTFESRNPAHPSEIIGVFPRSVAVDVKNAIAAAEEAHKAWRLVPAPHRGDVVLKASMIIERRKEELSVLMTREMGKVLTEARGDVQEAIDMGKYIAGEGRRFTGQTVPSELRDKFAMLIRDSIGVVGLITPWNFPLAIPSWKIFPALLCGNGIVFKPAEDTPTVATVFVQILEEAGVPPGVLNLVHGFGPEAGQPLLEDPRVRMISFTGSSDVGRLVAEEAGKRLKRVSLELGGKNAIVVMEDADVDLVVDGALWGGFGTSGQRCTASSRLIVHQGIANRVTEALVERVRTLKVGDGLDPTVQVGPVINREQLDRVHSYTAVGTKEGARLLTGGKILSDQLDNGHFYAPTLFDKVEPTMRIAQEEIFGPTVGITSVTDFDHALEVANGTEYGLSLAIYTKDIDRAFRAIRDLQSGLVYVNAPTIGAEIQLPFGGIKGTGNGHREAGFSAIEQFSELKSVYIDYSGKLQRAQIDV